MIGAVFLLVVALGFYLFYVSRRQKVTNTVFPEAWRNILTERVHFYKKLDPVGQTMFEMRVQRFLDEKRITGIDTEVDDEVRLLVAASAIIPTFSFPTFNYPNVNEVLIYPNAFNSRFETASPEGGNITGMVGNQFLNGIVILSKPNLLKAFDGKEHEFNVGVHEFVHLIDGLDGSTDGVPKTLIQNSFALPWLTEVRREMKRIRENDSDINPYALTNEAEFLAVASEYFFDAPEKFEQKHPELYAYMAQIFHKNLSEDT